MQTPQKLFSRWIIALSFFSLVTFAAWAQTASVQPRINQAVDDSKLVVLRGNVHPMARSEFDRGVAPASLAMDRMQLVLTHSAQQDAALQQLLAQQQDRSSPNYHKWLTPEQFGEQFGAAGQDIQTVSSWLQSHGFHVDEVAKGGNLIEFSGNAGQVQDAFHAAIHKYVLPSGEEHWANASNPEIPAALAPVVAGVNTLNDFRKKPESRPVRLSRKSPQSGRANPQLTIAGCQDPFTGATVNCYGIGPNDFGTIYNVTPLWNLGVTGTGQSIAIVSDSNINPSDVSSFRSLFGLSANLPKVILNGANPGVITCDNGGDECEAILDVEWAGAVAPSATIDLVVSESTNTTFGGDLSAVYIVNNNTAPILSYSFGACELALGTAENQFYNNEWSQAASLGITVVVSTGDNGAAGCDFSNPNSATAQPAETGLAVNGLATTPFNVAVGGTDFNDFSNPSTYFSTTSVTVNSAKSYIPEITYNDTCTNSIVYNVVFGFSNGEQACNSSTVQGDGLVMIAGGGGGASNCIVNATTAVAQGPVSSCSAGYAKPSWQKGTGVPNDGVRDIPDLSLFAGDGLVQNFYIVCEQDSDSQENTPCNLNNGDFTGIGGTSVSAQAFAGMMALIDQQAGSRQGNPNPNFYRLAASQSVANCNSSGTVSGSCIFNDVTSGTIAMPCAQGSPNCTVATSGDTIGVLNGYSAGTGYDLATGLGSVNACNLVENWGSGNASFVIGTGSCPASLSIASPGASSSATVTVSGIGGFTGTVTFACSGLPSGATCTFNPTSVALSATTTSATTQVTVNTTTASFLAPSNWIGPLQNQKEPYGIVLLFALSFAIWMFSRGKRQRRVGFTVLSLAVGGLLMFAAGCGGGSSSSNNGVVSSTTGPTGLTHATITATSGSLTQTTAFNVTIQ